MSLNVHGLGNRQKRLSIINHFLYPTTGHPPPDIIFFQETHSSLEMESLWKQDFKCRNIYFSHDKPNAGGLLTIIKSHVPFKLKNVVRSESFLLIHCTIDGEDYVLVNLRNPLLKPQKKFSSWLFDLWTAVSKFPTHKILLGGDFNALLDENDSRPRTLPYSRVFNQFLEESDLTDCWRVFHPTDVRYTYYYKNGSHYKGSRLDYFLVSPLLLNYLSSTSIGIKHLSDHAPIYVSFYLQRNVKGPRLFRFPNFLTSDDTYSTALAETIQDVITCSKLRICPEDRPSPPLLWDTVKAAIRGRTIEYLSNRKRKIRELQRLSDELGTLQESVDSLISEDHPVDDLLLDMEDTKVKFSVLDSQIQGPRKTRNISRSQVFSNTCSSYFFQKVRGIPGALRHIFSEGGDLVTTDEEILTTCQAFYDNLYTNTNPASLRLNNFNCPPSEYYLTDDERQSLGADITKEDVEYALKSMKTKKCPGADGLTVEFYNKYWPLVGDMVYESIIYAYEVGHFTIQQRRGVVKLLPKSHKDPRYVENLRPITLLNVDYKLLTKILAERLKVVLPRIIHTDQNGFIKNRFLGNNILDVYSLMSLADQAEDDNWVLLSLDIRKAFDSVNWDFLLVILRNYGFPASFIRWIEIMQQNACIQISNNGYLSDSIVLQKGLAQGCGASPYLIILVIEALANCIRKDEKIPGIELSNTVKKASLIADDSLFSFKGSIAVMSRVRTVLDHFTHSSGLSINYQKSILVGLGSHPLDWCNDPCTQDFQKTHISTGFKYLGLWLSSNRDTSMTKNFVIESNLVDSCLANRCVCKTTITGRILQLKSLVASKFVYKFMNLPSPPKEVFDFLDRMYFAHVWNGQRHRLRKEIMFQPQHRGGFSMINICIQNDSLKFAWLNRLLSESVNMQFWSVFLCTQFCIPINEFLKCNLTSANYFRLVKPGASIPAFWDDVFCKWFDYFHIDRDCSLTDVSHLKIMPISYNDILPLSFHGKLHEFVMENNIICLEDFILNGQAIIQSVTLCEPLLLSVLTRMIQQLPMEWINLILRNPNIPRSCSAVDRCMAGLLPAKGFSELLTPQVLNNGAIKHWEEALDCPIEDFVWITICKKIKLLRDTTLLDFHIQFLNHCYHYNMKISSNCPTQNPNCSFCFEDPESYMHLFWECPYVFSIWTAVQDFCHDYVDSEEFSSFKCLLSNFQCKLLNIITVVVEKIYSQL